MLLVAEMRDGGEKQLTDELLGAVVETVRPKRPTGRGPSWGAACETERDRIAAGLNDDNLHLDVTKLHDLLTRRGIVVPYRTVHRFASQELGYRRQQPTVRVADGEPGRDFRSTSAA
jgi:hypothetical protein